jgi:hypothetical protein
MVIATLGSELQIPNAIYKFIVFMLLIKVRLSGGIAIRNGNLVEMLLPGLFAFYKASLGYIWALFLFKSR